MAKWDKRKMDLLERAHRTMRIDARTERLLENEDIDFAKTKYYLVLYAFGQSYEELRYMHLKGYDLGQLNLRLKKLLRYKRNREKERAQNG